MTQPKIVVVGSLNMDLVLSIENLPRIGETVRGYDMHTMPGGKGANQAIGCAKLGAQVSMIGAVGADDFGDQLLKQLESHDISTEYVARLNQIHTGTATIMHTQDDNCIIIVAGANACCTPEHISRFESLIREADIVLVQLEIPIETVEHVLQIARNAGVCTVLNPAPAAILTPSLLSNVDYITPNETEFEMLTGLRFHSENELEDAMRQWNGVGKPSLILTRGEKGSTFLKEDGTFEHVSAPETQVVDTTGAGDCFNAALSVSLARGNDLDKAVRFAVKAASISVTRFGAQNGMPLQSEVENTWKN